MNRSARWATLLCASSVTLAMACGDGELEPPIGAGGSTGAGGIDGGGGGGGTGGPLSLTWSACNLFTGGPEHPAECATAEVPLRRDEPTGPTIELFIKKLPAAGRRRGSLWLLDGGPGGGGIGPEGQVYVTSQLDDGLDIYIPVHRGTGKSTKLVCPAQEAPTSPYGPHIVDDEWIGCIDHLEATWGDGLAGFSTTEAARDVAELIEAEREPGDAIFVWGSSYGTYLANRYLQLYPDQATGIIMEAVCPPTGCNLDQFDVLYDGVAAEFLAFCGEDPLCSSYLGPDPRARLQDLYASLDDGHCAALASLGVDWRTLRVVLGQMLNHWNYRLGIAPVIHRLERCDAADVDAFVHLVGLLFGKPGDPPGPFLEAWSFPLSHHIVFSELWTDPPPAVDSLIVAADATLISQGSTLGTAELFPLWPRYQRDEYFGKWGDNDLPMLMFNGDLDPATPIAIAQDAADHFQGDRQSFVAIPRAPHNAFFWSPVGPSQPSCGMILVQSFLAAPEAPLDTSCADNIMPLNFGGAPWLAEEMFGVGDMFDNP